MQDIALRNFLDSACLRFAAMSLAEAGRPLRVALGSFTQPWSFGPYAKQLTILASQLARRHLVVWLAFSYPDTDPKVGVPNLPENVTMLGCAFPKNTGFYVSRLNKLLRDINVDALITLMDMNRVFVDEMLAPTSIAWFPNHFVTLDLHSRHALTAYDAVAVLGPSDSKRVAEQLPHKHVTHVPHVVEDPQALQQRGRGSLRDKFGMPRDRFVVLVNFANYAADTNRKSVDVSLLAFRDFLAARPDGFLYLHAVTLPTEGMPLPAMIAQLALPSGAFTLDTRELRYEESLELQRAADVLQRGQSRRVGGATDGHRQLVRLHLKAWGCPPHW